VERGRGFDRRPRSFPHSSSMPTKRRERPHQPGLYGVAAVAQTLGVSTRTVQAWRAAGRLPGYWLTKSTWVCDRKDLLRFVRSCPRTRPTHWDDLSKARAAFQAKVVREALSQRPSVTDLETKVA
jgi:hypothetical protein